MMKLLSSLALCGMTCWMPACQSNNQLDEPAQFALVVMPLPSGGTPYTPWWEGMTIVDERHPADTVCCLHHVPLSDDIVDENSTRWKQPESEAAESARRLDAELSWQYRGKCGTALLYPPLVKKTTIAKRVSYCPKCREADNIWYWNYYAKELEIREHVVLENPIIATDPEHPRERVIVQVALVNRNQDRIQLIDQGRLQLYLQRLGADSSLPTWSNAKKRQVADGVAYATCDWEGCWRSFPDRTQLSGESYVFKYPLDVKDLPAGRYRLYIVHESGQATDEVQAEFEIKR